MFSFIQYYYTFRLSTSAVIKKGTGTKKNKTDDQSLLFKCSIIRKIRE